MERAEARVPLDGLLPAAGDPAGSRAATLAAADEIFALVYRQMRALAGRRDVDELAQIAVEHVLRGLPRFEGRSQLATWTFRICYLTVRKHDRGYRRWLRRFTLTDDGELPERAGDASQGEEGVVRRERLRRLQAAMQGLSPKRRAVLVMHDVEGMTVDEIAAVVQASPAAVRSRLRDARRSLARRVAADPYFGSEACAKKETTP